MEEPKYHAYFRHEVKDLAYRCFWCPHEDIVGTDFLQHVKMFHGYDITVEAILVYFETTRVKTFVTLYFCDKCSLRSSDSSVVIRHKRTCDGPPKYDGNTFTINMENLESFLCEFQDAYNWVKGQNTTTSGTPPAVLAPPPTQQQQPQQDEPTEDAANDVEKADDDGGREPDEECNESNQNWQNEKAAAAAEQQGAIARSTPQGFTRSLPSRGRGQACAAMVEEITTRRRMEMLSMESAALPVQAQQTPYETQRRVPASVDVLERQCAETGHFVAAIGDLLPVRRSTALTVQRLYFSEQPMPGVYQLYYNGAVYAKLTASAFPQNIQLRRWKQQEHDMNDEYVAHVWCTDTIPATMTAWVTTDVAIDDGRYDVVEKAPNARATTLTVTSDWLFRY